jgi:invasion protein IalB
MRRVLIAVAALALTSPAIAATTLPGGATTLTETHDDWTVRCNVSNSTVHCVAQQEQLSNQTKQRVLAIEMLANAGNVLTGTLVLPFGLLLAKGAVLKVDDKLTSPPEPFETCLPSGCIVPLSIGKDWLNAMRSGTELAVSAVAVNGQDAKFSISLKGLGPALDRIADLTK